MKFRFLISLMLTAQIAGLTACGGANTAEAGAPAAATPADSLAARLTEIYNSRRTMVGHHDDPVYGHSWCGDSCRSDVLETAGGYPAMMSWDLGGLEMGRDENLDGVSFARMRDEVRRQHERGGFSTFSWHLFSPVDSIDCWTIGDSLTVKKILGDEAVNAAFRGQLKALAGFFGSLTDAEGRRIPVIFRPLHEHTGSWFWWGKPYATPEEYRSMWKIIGEEFDKAGVDNVLMAYSPDRFKTEEEYLEYYPGDDVVDILGVDIYLFGGADGIEEYDRTARTALSVVNKLSRERGKVAAFTETGSEGVPVDDWWTDVLLPILKAEPVAYVVLWRNAHDKPGHFYVPYAGHSSADSFRTFCNDSSMILVKDNK